MNNVSIFKDFLNQKNLFMEELSDGNGVFFRSRESIDHGGELILIVSFNSEEDIVDLDAHNIANITNPLKKEQLQSLLNELNKNFRFVKFVEVDGQVTSQYSFFAEKNNLDPEFLFDNLLMLIRTSQESYPKFMKLQWS